MTQLEVQLLTTHGSWASNARIMTHEEVPLKVEEEVTKLLKLSIPSRLFDELQTGISNHSADPERLLFAQKLLSLKPSLTAPSTLVVDSRDYDFEMELTNEPDQNNIVLDWMAISDGYSEIVTACRSKKRVKEFTIRRGVDTLLVRSQGVPRGLTISVEEELRLRRSDAPGSPVTASADVALTSRMPTNLRKQLRLLIWTNRSATHEANWLAAFDNPAAADLLWGAMEYKRFDRSLGYRQLVYDLSTAQSVRRALGLNEETLYGWTSAMASGTLTMEMYASWWDEDNFICVSGSLRTCRVSEPIGSLAFYNFHCDYLKRNKDLVKAIDDEKFEGLATSLVEHSWRTDDTRGKRKRKGGPSGDPTPLKKAGSGRRSNNMEHMEDSEVRSSCDGWGPHSSSEDEERSEENLSILFGLPNTKGVQRPLNWISKHVEAVDLTTLWMDHRFERANEDLGVVVV